MKNLVLLFVGLLSVFALAQAPENNVDVYPGPKGIKPSKNYEVSVTQNDDKKTSFVYYSSPLDNDAENAERVRHDVVKGINENEKLKDFYFKGKGKRFRYRTILFLYLLFIFWEGSSGSKI